MGSFLITTGIDARALGIDIAFGMTLVILVAYLAVHGLFCWGMFAVFRTPRPTPVGARMIVGAAGASIAAGIALIWRRGSPQPVLDVLALAAVAAAAGLFLAAVGTVGRGTLTAVFSTDTPRHLVTTGPYRWLRNPFYAAYTIGHAVPLLATGNVWALPGLLLMAAIYHAAACAEERKFMASPLAAAWDRYAARTGRFLPRWQTLYARFSGGWRTTT